MKLRARAAIFFYLAAAFLLAAGGVANAQGLNPLNPGNIFGGTQLDPKKTGAPNLDPLPHIQILTQGILSGDTGKAREGLGGLLLNSPGCLGCEQIAHQILPTLSAAQINQIAGTGILTFATTGDPYLVVFSVATGIVEQVSLADAQTSEPSGSTPGPPPSKERPHQIYTATATCMIERDGIIWAAWSPAIVLTDSLGHTFTVPDVDLQPGDTLKVISPKCPWDDPTTHSIAITQATFTYSTSKPAFNDQPDTVKMFLLGPKLKS